MLSYVESVLRQVTPTVVLDIAITALFIYSIFSLIRGTRAVTLVAGVSVLLGIYAFAQLLDLRLFTQLLQAGAFLGVFALVVVFQPELRRGLERIGRVGTLGWLMGPHEEGAAAHVAAEVAKAAAAMSREGHGALIVIERSMGLEEIVETGVLLRAELTAELLRTVFTPKTPLHDGAVIIRNGRLLAAAALLPLSEIHLSERFGTRHRAALGVTEDSDAVAVVVSEENHQMSVVERARIVRVPTEAQLERALAAMLEPVDMGGGLGARVGRTRRELRLPVGDRLRAARTKARRPVAVAADGTAAGTDAAPADALAVVPTAIPADGPTGAAVSGGGATGDTPRAAPDDQVGATAAGAPR